MSITDLSNLDNASQELGDWYYVLLAAGILIAIIVVVFVTFYTKYELKKIMSKVERDKRLSNQNRVQEINGIEIPVPLNEYNYNRSFDQREINSFVLQHRS